MVAAKSTHPREALDRAHDRHLAAVARSLGWARESAARGDYADALGWVRVVEAIPAYQKPSPGVFVVYEHTF